MVPMTPHVALRAKLGFAFALLVLLGVTSLIIPARADEQAATSLPSSLIVGPDGNLWFTEITSSRIARLTASGKITEFLTPTVNAHPSSIAIGADGNLWFSEQQGNAIGRVTPTGGIREFRLPIKHTNADMVILGPDKRIWFASHGPYWHMNDYQPSHVLGAIDTAGTVREVSRTPKGVPAYVAVGPVGNVWFDDPTTGSLLRVSPSLTVRAIKIPSLLLIDPSIAFGPDGNLWVHGENSIIRVTPDGVAAKFAVPTPSSEPSNLIVGPDGNIWFVERRGNKIARMTPQGGHIVEFTLMSPQSDPGDIIVGPDKRIWFTEGTGNRIGRISLDGEISEFVVPAAGSYPKELVAGPDGNLWFTEPQSNRIGRITPAGDITEFPIPSRVDTRLEHTPPPTIHH